MESLLAAALGAGAVLLVLYSLREMFSDKARFSRLKTRVERHAKNDRMAHGDGPVSMQGLGHGEGWRNELGSLMGTVGEKLGPKEVERINALSQTLLLAGYRHRQAPMMLWGAKASLLLGGILVGLTVKMLWGAAEVDSELLSLALYVLVPGAIGFYLPDRWLSFKVSSRKVMLANALPDALDLLVLCVEAGMGFDQAIERVSKELIFSCADLAEEFSIVVAEMRAGKPRGDALKSLTRRVGLEDLDSLVTLIIQADKFGTSIAHTLRVYSDTMRTARFQRAEEIAAKLPVKMLFPLMFFILPALFVVIIGPAGIQLMGVFAQMNQ